MKVAVTLSAALIVTWQVSVPEQPPPDQPVKTEPASVLAVKVTVDPASNMAEHVALQLIPEVWLVIDPAPEPPVEAVRSSGAVVTSELASGAVVIVGWFRLSEWSQIEAATCEVSVVPHQLELASTT